MVRIIPSTTHLLSKYVKSSCSCCSLFSSGSNIVLTFASVLAVWRLCNLFYFTYFSFTHQTCAIFEREVYVYCTTLLVLVFYWIPNTMKATCDKSTFHIGTWIDLKSQLKQGLVYVIVINEKEWLTLLSTCSKWEIHDSYIWHRTINWIYSYFNQPTPAQWEGHGDSSSI